MKNILLFLAFSTTILFTSCQGDPGPPGQDGVSFLGKVFETTVNFNSGNNFENLITFPSNVEVYESDVVLVYHLVETIPGNGGSIDVWEQLPQTYFPPQGTLLYSFDHTFLDVKIFLDANFDLNTLGSEFTNNQTFRIAVVPAEFAKTNPSMKQVLEMMQMDGSQIEKIEL
ncbi:MAG: hypothetical protein JJE55_10880 [Flavobacteriaceae bacterium]|nr:hypothetical protein [Flavobacteriaceae bacterium]